MAEHSPPQCDRFTQTSYLHPEVIHKALKELDHIKDKQEHGIWIFSQALGNLNEETCSLVNLDFQELMSGLQLLNQSLLLVQDLLEYINSMSSNQTGNFVDLDFKIKELGEKDIGVKAEITEEDAELFKKDADDYDLDDPDDPEFDLEDWGSYFDIETDKKQSVSAEKPFKCDFCEKRFLTQTLLDTHLRTHTGERPFECEECDKTFINKKGLKSHMMQTHGQSDIRCEICGKTFRALSDLKIHVNTHTGIKPYECEVCRKGFGTAHQLNIHRRCHTGEKPFKCDECQDSFISKRLLRIHLMQVHDKDCFNCEYCERRFLTSRELENHSRIHTGERPFECKECGKSFMTSKGLKDHMMLTHGLSDIKCDICDRTFRSFSDQKRHMNEKHSGVLDHECDYQNCQEAFSTSHQLEVHKRVHGEVKPLKCEDGGDLADTKNFLEKLMETGSGGGGGRSKSEGPYYCKKCPDSYPSRTLLEQHRKEQHPKSWNCDVCQQHYTKLLDLKAHMLKEHNKRYKKAFICEQCGFAAERRAKLEIHMYKHTGETPFKCEVCSSTFTVKRSLVRHMALHTGEKPYQCDVCAKAFPHKSYLENHYRVHTGEKPYSCDVCGKAFALSYERSKHRRKAHGEVKFEVPAT